MTKKRIENNWPMMLLVAVVALGIGFLIGRMNMGNSEEVTASGADDKTPPTEAAAASAPANTISPEQLAKVKNVPAVVKSVQGDFTLVAVVEGENANKSLHRSLQVVGVQRQRLAQLSQKYDQTAPAMAQQRELIARQINETRATLEKNLRYMAQNFAYVLSNNYLLVPHQATLSAVEGTGKNQKKNLVYTFKDAANYEGFQKKSKAYAKLKQEQLKANQASQPVADKAPTHPLQPLPPVEGGKPVPLPLTPVMKTAQAEMIQIYQCDPEKQHLIEYQKTALYARKAK